MSRVLQSNKSTFQHQLWSSSSEDNHLDISTITQKVPEYLSGLSSTNKNFADSKSSPRMLKSSSYDEIASSQKNFQRVLVAKDKQKIPDDYSLTRSQENYFRKTFLLHQSHCDNRYSRSFDLEMTKTPRSLSDPGISLVSEEFDSSLPKSKSVNSVENHNEMPKKTLRSLSNESVISYFTERHTKKDLNDASSSSEITKLVANAGSAEAVISYLLKEKNSQASQNTQLWRLVDKQRAMILGLNGDLQRALKEKERYRKKIKEIVGKLTVSDHDNSSEKPKSHPKADNEDVESTRRIFLENTSSVPSKRNDEYTPDLPIEVSQALDPIVSISAKFDDGKINNLVKPDNKITNQSKRTSLPKYLPELNIIQNAKNHNTDKYSQLKNSSTEITDLTDTSDTTDMTDVTDMTDSTDATDVSLSTAKTNIIPSPTDESPRMETKEDNKEVDKVFHTQGKAPPTSVKVEKEKIIESSDYRSPDFRLNDEIRKETAPEARDMSKETNDSLWKLMKYETTRSDQDFGIRKSSEPSVSKTVSNNVINEPVPKLNLPKALNQNKANSERNSLLARRERANSELYFSPLTKSRLSLLSPSTGLPSSPRPVKHSSGLTPTISYLAKLTSPPQSFHNTRDEIVREEHLSLNLLSQTTSLQQPQDTQRLSISVTGVPKYDPFNLVTPKPLVIIKDKETSHSPIGSSSSKESKEYESDGIYRGFISEEYPGLLLPPSALEQIEVKVASSRLKPSRSSIMFPKNAEEDPVFTLALFTKSVSKEVWQIEKDLTSLIELDSTLKQYSTYNSKIPDKSLFNGHAPAKVDARRMALNKYFESLLENRSDFAAALDICKYLSSNVLGVNVEELKPVKTSEENFKDSSKKLETKKLKCGYLTKRGKNFGGWKARYFILDGPVLKYYESHGGSYLGAIRLHQAQIGKQLQTSDKGNLSQGEGDDSDRHYRHAFLILEPKKKNSSSLIRHVLCAESDAERDEWVDALCQYMKYKYPNKKKSSSEQLSQTNSNGSKQKVKVQLPRNQATQESSEDLFHAISYEETKLTSKPLVGKKDITETASLIETIVDKESSDGLSQPQSPNDVIANAQSSPSHNFRPNEQTKPPALDEKLKYRKRSFFGFGVRPKIPVEDSDNVGGRFPKYTLTTTGDQKPRLKAIFGMPLDEAVRYSRPLNVSVELPAVVYRCIEYLDAMHAFDEEGIFRLSGSSIVIKQLRERFNSEGDVDLIKDNQYYDIHAVASLLKLYLRELPSTILTGKLHPDFLAIIDLADTKEQINVLSDLVRKLPTENIVLLRHLASFLIKIIRKSDINRMTVRNVSIVFSPTLNIPASIFSLFLQQYFKIFDREPDYCSTPTETSLKSSNESVVANKEQTVDDRILNRAATVLAGPTFNKSIGASKTYRQNTPPINNNNNKSKKRDSSMFGINMTSLSQRRGSINR
ncbi:hypothetical protein Golomagni_00458 [Golovinomyces magnicellulatus]|nr:hypothetical protein Golomagni_00458 [Golovinomyces magnicellulatus]